MRQLEPIKKKKIVIKVPIPNWNVAHQWGEYHFALALIKQFRRKNWKASIQILPQWDSKEDRDCDVVMVLRGNSRYIPRKNQFNIMWNICHPDMVTISEYNRYDYVFVASKIWAQYLSPLCDVQVEALLQCTDPELFYSRENVRFNHELLFVGNSRFVYRKIIKDILPTQRDLAVYGDNWDWFIDRKYIKGIYISNKDLSEAYSSCKILLNDHWEDMREKGFLSNRLFDGFASEAFMISDNVNGSEEVFGDALITYETKEELEGLIDKYLEEGVSRTEKARKGYEIVTSNHTFERRVERIIEVIEKRIDM
jgi:glycosyltransferase involved in cell wall biosynthesis